MKQIASHYYYPCAKDLSHFSNFEQAKIIYYCHFANFDQATFVISTNSWQVMHFLQIQELDLFFSLVMSARFENQKWILISSTT